MDVDDLASPEVEQVVADHLELKWGPDVFESGILDRLVAITVVQNCWRNGAGHLEEWHGSGDPDAPSDFDMFRANITLTRGVLPAVTRGDLEGIRQQVTEPGRDSGTGSTASQFCGPAWEGVAASASHWIDSAAAMIDEMGVVRWRRLMAFVSSGSRWWGVPDFDERLRASFAAHRPEIDAAAVERHVERPEQMNQGLWLDVVYYRL